MGFHAGPEGALHIRVNVIKKYHVGGAQGKAFGDHPVDSRIGLARAELVGGEYLTELIQPWKLLAAVR